MIQILIVDSAKQPPSYDFDSNYKMLDGFLEEKFDILDSFAHELSIAPLSSFVGTLEAGFDFDKVSGKDASWFLVTDGINTVNGLLDFLKQSKPVARHKPTARRVRDFQRSSFSIFVIEELEELLEILTLAQCKSKAARFKLLVI